MADFQHVPVLVKGDGTKFPDIPLMLKDLIEVYHAHVIEPWSKDFVETDDPDDLSRHVHFQMCLKHMIKCIQEEVEQDFSEA